MISTNQRIELPPSDDSEVQSRRAIARIRRLLAKRTGFMLIHYRVVTLGGEVDWVWEQINRHRTIKDSTAEANAIRLSGREARAVLGFMQRPVGEPDLRCEHGSVYDFGFGRKKRKNSSTH